jgi:hypothetical protein
MSDLATVFYKTIKHNSSCVICKSPQIQFHHVLREEKIDEVGKIAKMGDLAATIQEVQKCLPVCQPHHTAIHKGIIPGYLRGNYDNGRRGDDSAAQQFMPYLNWFARKKKHILLEFYRDHIDREHQALWPVFNAAGLALPRSPRLALASGQCRQAANDEDSTPNLGQP